MKTAVSLPDDLFRRAETYATRLGMARSHLYALALADYLREHAVDQVTEALNDVYVSGDSGIDDDLAATQAHAISDEEW